MKLYRIYTENKNYDEVMEIASKSFKGFTVMKAEGYWRGIPEHGLVIEILADESEADNVTVVAYNIKKFNAQESVLVTESTIEHKFIGAEG